MHYITWRTSAGIITAILFITQQLGQSKAQNCAIPQIVKITEDCDLRRECAIPGTVLVELPTKYVQSVLSISQVPENFIDVQLNGDTISLVVNTSLCPDENEILKKSYIDYSWEKNVELEVEFLCSDGRPKTTEFVIPIEDENTLGPYFENSLYNITTGPCYNGTHANSCPINFEFPIVVWDEDRDIKNALMNFSTNSADIKLNVTQLEIQNHRQSRVINNLNRYKCDVHLYLKEKSDFDLENGIEFDLKVYNTQKSNKEEVLYGSTRVRIYFGETPPMEYPEVVEPPRFSSSAYHAVVRNLRDAQNGSELNDILPTRINTYTTSSLGYGYDGGDTGESQEKVQYQMKSDIFSIEETSGRILYKTDLSQVMPFTLWNEVQIYEIVAVYPNRPFFNASVPLVVFFNIEEGNSTEGPGDCSSTTISPSCPECPTVCPTTPTDCSEQPTETPIYGNGTTTTENYEATPDPSSTTESVTNTTTEIPEGPTTSFTTHPNTTTESSDPSSTTTTTSTLPELTTIPTIVPTSEPISITTDPMFPTTPASGNSSCTCFKRIEDFKCPTERDENSLYSFPDPHNCQVFHLCISNGSDGVIDIPKLCPEGLSFCPQSSRCDFIDVCEVNCKSENKDHCKNTECEYDEHTDPCIGSRNPDNICKAEGDFADPNYFDVWHNCRPETLGSTTKFIDCLTPCAKGTVWCEDIKECTFAYVCPSAKYKSPYQCDLCSTSNAPPDSTTDTSDLAPLPEPTTIVPSEPTTTTDSTSGNSSCSCFERVEDFKCPSEGYENKLYSDSHNCEIFHQCTGTPDGVSQMCPKGLYFCPLLSRCGFLDECQMECKSESKDCTMECEYDEQTNPCRPSEHPENICEKEGDFGDSRFSDVWHNCRPEIPGSTTKFIDCLQPCSKGTVWCPEIKECAIASDCPSAVGVPYKCDLCQLVE